MADVLYGFDPATVVGDTAGNTFASRVAALHTTFVGNNPFSATKAVVPATLTAGAATAGLVTSETNGRVGFFATDYYATLYLDFGDGTRWPVNPTKQLDATTLVVTAATAGKVDKGSQILLASDYGVVGNGVTDDSAALNALLITAAAAGKEVLLAPGSTLRCVSQISVPSNTQWNLNGATLVNASAATNGKLVSLSGVGNVSIYNGILDGAKASFATATEQRHNIRVQNSSRVTFRDIYTINAKGDGMYVGDDAAGYSSDISLYNVLGEYNHRNGLSITAVSGFKQFGGGWRYTGGTSPQSGCDIEPNGDYIPVEKIEFHGVSFDFNDWNGFIGQGRPSNVLTITGTPTGGTFTITGSTAGTTSALAYNASAATVQTAMRLLGTNYASTLVTGSAGGPYTVTNMFANVTLTTSAAGLTGGTSPDVVVSLIASALQRQGGVRLIGCTMNGNGVNPDVPGAQGHGISLRYASDYAFIGCEARNNGLAGVRLRELLNNLTLGVDFIGNGWEGVRQVEGDITDLRVTGKISGNGTLGTYDGINLASTGRRAFIDVLSASNTRYGIRSLAGWSEVTYGAGCRFSSNTTGTASLADLYDTRTSLSQELGWRYGSTSSTTGAMATRTTSDTVDRFGYRVDGRLYWSSGSAALDTTLERTAAGTLSVGAGHALRTGRAVTASRPSAVTVGAGAMFYDTTLGSLLTSNGTVWTAVGSGGGAATPPQFDVFTASGTWTKPAGCTTVRVIAIGGGGGGGSGRRGAVSTVRCGGGGGGGAATTMTTFDAGDLASTITVTIGAAGTGGAAITADDTSGNTGGAAGNTTFGTQVMATVGAPGVGGTAALGTGGGAGFGTVTGNAGGAASTTGLVGNAGTTTGGGGGAGGGGAGGGITAANVAATGVVGGASRQVSVSSGSTAGAVDSTTPTAGTLHTIKGVGGHGAGSGAASITTAAQAGATANGYGAGGGGGGASLNGNNSGAGGNGSPGYCLVISYF